MGVTMQMFQPQSEKLRYIINKATQFAPKDRYSSVVEILKALNNEGNIPKGLAEKARTLLVHLRSPIPRRKRVDANSVEEILAEKILSFRPVLPNAKEDYAFSPKRCTLEPFPRCPGDDQYVFPSKETAQQQGLQAFEQFIYSQRKECVRQALVFFRETQLRNFLMYEITKENYYHQTNRKVEGRIQEIMEWARKNGLPRETLPKGLESFSCTPNFHGRNEASSCLWNLEHFEYMDYTAPIHALLDKWSGAIPPIAGYKRYIETRSRLVSVAKKPEGESTAEGENSELCPVDLYAFRTNKAAKELQEDILYATMDLVWQSDALRQDIHGAIRDAYGDRLKKALEAKADEIRQYFRRALGY